MLILRHSNNKIILRWLLFMLFIPMSMNSWGVDPLLSLEIGKAEAKLKVLEKLLNKPKTSLDLTELEKYQEQGLFVKKMANKCIEVNEGAINKSADDLELLGPQALSEDKEVTLKRQSLNNNMLGHAQQLASCRLLLLRAHQVVNIVLQTQHQKLTSQLLAKTDNLFENIKENLLHPIQVMTAAVVFLQEDSGLDEVLDNLILLGFLVLLAWLMVVMSKRGFKSSLKRHASTGSMGYLSQFQLSLISSANRHMPTLILTAVLSLYFVYHFVTSLQLNFLGLLIFGLFFYVTVNLFIRVILNPVAPAQPLTSLPIDVSLLLARRLRLLSKLLLAGFLMYSALEMHEFPTQITALLRNIYLFLLVLNLIWAVWLFRFYKGITNANFFRLIIIAGLLLCLVADWMGYTRLADFILIGITGSMLLWSLTIFILRLWKDLLDSLDEGRNAWQQRFRKRIGIKVDDYLPGSIWLRFTFALIVWSVFAGAILKLWGLPDASLLLVKEMVTDGFEIGKVNIVPLKVVLGLVIFSLMLSLIGWIKRRMDKSWLKHSRMDRGSKESMISLTGYLGIAISFLIALSIAGVELTNLALIAGALSLGIGFGLQNIVNNFISGVILLFERPIKTGDWIVVGGTEGYVKKISIRSTQIQTFNRSDVIVPNSELISSQVTNLMLRDSIGRITVPVGVAYGTNPEQVRDILIDIAHQHAEVLTQSPILPRPVVLFSEFGDSSLNFELRCFIRNVDDRRIVISDINFEIEKAFREEGIEIPFPQRDVHLITNKE